jgi:hypothetical protein
MDVLTRVEHEQVGCDETADLLPMSVLDPNPEAAVRSLSLHAWHFGVQVYLYDESDPDERSAVSRTGFQIFERLGQSMGLVSSAQSTC